MMERLMLLTQGKEYSETELSALLSGYQRKILDLEFHLLGLIGEIDQDKRTEDIHKSQIYQEAVELLKGPR